MLSIVLFYDVYVVFFLGLPLLPDLCASGLRCLVPALAAQFVQSQQPLIVGPASAVTACPAPALALQGVGSQSFMPSLLLLFVEFPWGLFCGILSLWPLVAPYPSVISRLGLFLWRLFRLGFEVLRPWLWILPSFSFFFWGGGAPLSFPCPCCFSLAITTFSFCPGNLGFLDFLLGFFSRLPVFLW